MKRGLVFGIVLGLVLINLSFISAVACASSDNTIMKLYLPSNSHGATWNGSSLYLEEVCYSGTAPTNPHKCSLGDSNVVLWLSAINNSHASISKIIGSYETPVCYGDFTCDYTKTNQAECTAWGGTIIASLYDINNSHISVGDDSNYPIKICCKSTTVIPVLGDVYWADMEGTPINEAQINDTVMLVYSDASPGNFFEIYEDDGTVGDDDVRTGTNKLNSVLRDGKSIAIWKITDEDYKEGCCFLGVCENQGQFYFKANGDSDLTSLNLNVSTVPDNSPPFVKIIKPEYESKHLLGADIDYEQIAVDIDDDLELTWTFGDGTTANFDDVKTQNLGNTTHIYDSTGVKNIVLTAKEMTREKEASNRSRVLIYDEGVHTYALIDSPVPDVPYSYQRIPIIANRSHIAECFSDSGACSTKASSWSSSCYPVTGSIGGIANTLYCFDYPTSQTLSGYNLFFEWTFDPGKGYESKRAGSWNDNYEEVIDSYKVFTRTGRHDINLIMGYLFD